MEQRDISINKVGILGIIINLLLLCIKLVVGLLSRSQAMIADSINSAGDIFASFMSFIGGKVSSKPKDDDHPYGHGKAEYIFSELISIFMIIVALVMLNSSIQSIILNQKLDFSIWLVVVCIVTIIVKLCLYVYTKVQYRKYNSILIKASMEDHRNDMFLTTSTLIGVTCGYFNIYIIDFFVGILIALRIIYIGLKILIESFMVLIDTGLNYKELKQIYNKVKKYTKELRIINIISKPIGNKYLLIIKVTAANNVSVKRIKKEVKRIKKKVKQKFEYIYEVIIDFKG